MNERVITNKYTENEKEGVVDEVNGLLTYVEHDDGTADWYDRFELDPLD